MNAAADARVAFVERVFEFFFEGTFAEQIAARGFPEGELDIWHLNAQAFCRLTLGHDLSDEEKVDLLTLIESARFAVLAAQEVPGFAPEFSFDGYEMPTVFKDRWGDKIVREVLSQPVTSSAIAWSVNPSR